MFNINKVITHTIEVLEKGFVNHKADKGKATRWGITESTLGDHLGLPRDYPELPYLISELPKRTAAMIYKANYYYQPKINLLPDSIQEQVFDIGVNSGPNRAYKILQQAINKIGGNNLVIDGKFGAMSWDALDLVMSSLDAINNEMVDFRRDFYHKIVKNNSSQKVFINGWLNRAEKFRI
jgi:lysozyme family protein